MRLGALFRFLYDGIRKVVSALCADVFPELRARYRTGAEPPVPAKEYLYLLTTALAECLHKDHLLKLFIHNTMFRGETKPHDPKTEILFDAQKFLNPSDSNFPMILHVRKFGTPID